ncbi:hypothetical protein D5W64_12270 [Salmonella enterica subsp. enterica serovar Saintpaul]|nr:hypothetical protein [Salmonella enterica subsp. enterica serovar Saintpaul]
MNLVQNLIKKVAVEKQSHLMDPEELDKFLKTKGPKYFEDLLLIAKLKSVYCIMPLENPAQYKDLEYLDERFIQFDNMVKCIRQRASSLTKFTARFATLKYTAFDGHKGLVVIPEQPDEKPTDLMFADMTIALKGEEIHIVRWMAGPSGLVLHWGKGLNFEEAK